MKPVAIIITQPVIDFKTFVAVTHKALGRSIAAASDKAHDQHPIERYLSCLAAMRDELAPAGLPANLLYHVSFSLLIAADQIDTIPILECAAGMPFVTVETINDSIDLTVVYGTLAQWRDAVVSGTRRTGEVQALYCSIMSQFEGMNLNVWPEYNKKWSNGLFLLEDKRK
jgi:hypothetical protein